MTAQEKVFDLAQSAKEQTRKFWSDLSPGRKMIVVALVGFFLLAAVFGSHNTSQSPVTSPGSNLAAGLRELSNSDMATLIALLSYYDTKCEKLPPPLYDAVEKTFQKVGGMPEHSAAVMHFVLEFDRLGKEKWCATYAPTIKKMER